LAKGLLLWSNVSERWQMTPEDRLAAVLGRERVSTALLDRVAYSSDASLYQLIPRAVARVQSITDVQELFAWSRRERVPVTFRAAGTSLSGQAVTDNVLAVVEGFDTFHVAPDGSSVTAGCSLRGGYVNARLRPNHCRIGPDPASIDACTIGGIVANNASGMCCGIAQNAYHTLRGMSVVLLSGLVLNTRDIATADALLAEREPALYAGLATLRDEIRADRELTELIRHRTRLKNTMGYSLAAFLDYDRPADILQHLMVGSEGTLGFIADVTLATVPEPPFAATLLAGFDSIAAACDALAPFDDVGAVAIELMDDATLRAIRRYASKDATVRLPDTAALLVECRSADPEHASTLGAMLARVAERCNAREYFLAANDRERTLLWHLRKGAMPSVGAARRPGSALINEDVAFPREQLARAVADLGALLHTHGFADAVIFGHARDGNMHFAFSLDSGRLERYEAFMDALATLVVERYDGSLKAEHSTGRNMAPYVEQQWGAKATAIMWRIKELFDPEHLLNRDVVLTRDRKLHLRNIKTLPPVHPLVERCIECGFCERVCPSAGLTLSPRQRIVVLRQIERCRIAGDRDALRVLERGYRYAGEETCAADGLCMLACPVGVDTGTMTLALRARRRLPLGKAIAARFTRAWIASVGAALSAVRLAAHVFGERQVHTLTRWLSDRLHTPVWLPTMGVPDRIALHRSTAAQLVYLPSCMACFGGRTGDISISEALFALAQRAVVPIAVASSARRICCGQPWHSSGADHAFQRVQTKWLQAAHSASDSGRIPVVLDSSSCALSLRRTQSGLRILDPVEAVAQLAPAIARRVRGRYRVVLHPGCSLERLGQREHLVGLLEQLGCEVIIPFHAGCCGIAGDRGLRYAKLPVNALKREAVEIASIDADFYIAVNLPCQWQLAHTTGKPFVHLWQALEQMTR
jgi:D-lactate dehydrogenase